jgi:hypothetical protein
MALENISGKSMDNLELHFSINGMGITNLLRQMPANKGMEILECFVHSKTREHLTRDQKQKVLDGNAILTNENGELCYNEQKLDDIKVMEEKVTIDNIPTDNAWISPDGEIYWIGFQEHVFKAEDIVNEMEKRIGKRLVYFAYDHYLEKHGWFKITEKELLLPFLYNEHFSMTRNQLDALKKIFLECNKTITFDYITYSAKNYELLFDKLENW